MIEINQGQLVDAVDQTSHDLSRELADIWFGASQDTLAEADSQHDSSNYHTIMQSAHPPTWRNDAWVFSYQHVAAVFAEWGTEPHEIEAATGEFLAFEWPDAPQEVREQFSETFPLVFLKKVRHPGTPEIGYVRAGREEAVFAARRGEVV